MKLLVGLVVAGAVVLGGCAAESSQDTSSTNPTSVTTQSPTTTQPAATPATTVAPVLYLDGNIDWVLGVLNGADTSAADVGERFSAVLEEYVAPTDFLVVVDQLRSTVSERWVEANRRDSGTGAELSLDTDDGVWGMAISVDGDGLIETLLLQPAPPEVEGEPLASFDDLVDRLEVNGRTSVLVADVASGACDPLYVHDDVTRPIGSVFKLYVLGALADAIARGELSWDDVLVIDDDLKSLPSGTFQTRPEGSEATVREFARAMISISDNTATDHLIDLLGRSNVEEALVDYGNTEVTLNLPFLTTQEFFALKLAVPEEVADSYASGDETLRRSLLADQVAGVSAVISDAVTWVSPYLIDDIEWFASSTSLCRALIGLVGAADPSVDGEVRDIMSANPGVSFDTDTWSYVGYKGGSEPGVLSLAWYLESHDGRAFVYVVNVSNPEEVLPEATLATLAGSGLDLITDLGG